MPLVPLALPPARPWMVGGERRAARPAGERRAEGRDAPAHVNRAPLFPVLARRVHDAHVVLAVVRNEMLRLPYLLSHYRRLGFDHFIFVDNDSTDGTGEYLAGQPDCFVYFTKESFGKSGGGAGLGWASGLRLYAVLFGLGALHYLGIVTLPTHLEIVAHRGVGGGEGGADVGEPTLVEQAVDLGDDGRPPRRERLDQREPERLTG